MLFKYIIPPDVTVVLFTELKKLFFEFIVNELVDTFPIFIFPIVYETFDPINKEEPFIVVFPKVDKYKLFAVCTYVSPTLSKRTLRPFKCVKFVVVSPILIFPIVFVYKVMLSPGVNPCISFTFTIDALTVLIFIVVPVVV